MLNWVGDCYAGVAKFTSTPLYQELIRRIHADSLCGIEYNPSKTAAIVNDDCRSAIYINFKTKYTYTITHNKLLNHVSPTWINDSLATVQDSCGTGCANVVVFLAPAISFACPEHQYRIEFLNENEPPDYYHNRPLLIDPKRKIVVCYDHENNIQVIPFPSQPTIHPPKGYFSERAEIQGGKLIVTYENGHGKVKHIKYGWI